MDRMYLQKTKGFYRLWACSEDRHYRRNGGPLTLAGAYREAGERVRNGVFNKAWERRQTELSEVDKWIDNENHVVAVVGDIRYRSCPCPGESLMVIGRNVVAGGFEVNTWFCETPQLVEFDVTEKGGWIVSRQGKALPRRFESEDDALQALGLYVLGGGDSELMEQEFTKLVLVPFDCLWQTQALVDDRWRDLGELTNAEVKRLIDSGVVTTP